MSKQSSLLILAILAVVFTPGRWQHRPPTVPYCSTSQRKKLECPRGTLIYNTDFGRLELKTQAGWVYLPSQNAE